MAENDPENKETKKEASRAPEDWSSDQFPTSARPVYRSLAMLVAIVLCLCAIVYSMSEPTPEDKEEVIKKQKVADEFAVGESGGEEEN